MAYPENVYKGTLSCRLELLVIVWTGTTQHLRGTKQIKLFRWPSSGNLGWRKSSSIGRILRLEMRNKCQKQISYRAARSILPRGEFTSTLFVYRRLPPLNNLWVHQIFGKRKRGENQFTQKITTSNLPRAWKCNGEEVSYNFDCFGGVCDQQRWRNDSNTIPWIKVEDTSLARMKSTPALSGEQTRIAIHKKSQCWMCFCEWKALQ